MGYTVGIYQFSLFWLAPLRQERDMKVQVIVKQSDLQEFIEKVFADKKVIRLDSIASINGHPTFEVMYK